MAELSEIVDFLDGNLRIREIPDYPGAMNGLQLENRGKVTRVAAAVDASLPVVEKAIAAGADLLLVHHGLFWQGAQRITGPFYRKIRSAVEGGLAIYSSHLPLDVHPEWGNNALLAGALGVRVEGGFLDFKGLKTGLIGSVDITRDDLRRKLADVVGGAVHLCPAGSREIRRVGICTGGAGSQVTEAVVSGIDAFITGEGPHWSYPLAEELGINLYYAGHYATETFGVRMLAGVLAERFPVEACFIDHPTGL
ncbi:MAG: Nif3-like dinuclear metal center hexameric protein [Akkermansiaceae bacterium]|jgi:dinuclear metal center YbgI/SA1388 family protein|nr:Nif3-like dinuclear metal center hexameric protein [Akkermansiaceae bacterium]